MPDSVCVDEVDQAKKGTYSLPQLLWMSEDLKSCSRLCEVIFFSLEIDLCINMVSHCCIGGVAQNKYTHQPR